MTLYELTTEYAALLMMAEDGDLDQETIADTLEGVDGEFEDKADGYAEVIRCISADIEAVKAEIDRLQKRKAVLQNNQNRIQMSLENAMRATGKTKFRTGLFSFGIQKNPASVYIDDEGAVPEEFWVPQKPTLDKAAVKAYLKENDVEWAHLAQTEVLRIR